MRKHSPTIMLETHAHIASPGRVRVATDWSFLFTEQQEQTMEDHIQLISDGDGLAVVGDDGAVKKFLDSVGLFSISKPLGMVKVGPTLGTAAGVMKGISDMAVNSCRYLKVDKETAQLIKKHGLMETKTPGISYAMLGKPGAVSKWVNVETGPGALVSNPAVLSGIAGIMAQVAVQQAMSEITDYLATIDEKVDDILRKMDDVAVAQLVGLGNAIERAMTIRGETGGVDEGLWSTVDQAHQIIGTTQSYALDQLTAIAKKLDYAKVGGLSKAVNQAESEIPRWLAVLARSFQLEGATNVLELDMKLAETPEGVVAYRRGMAKAVNARRESVSGHITDLLDRMDVAVGRANAKIVWNRDKSMEIVESANHLATRIHDFAGLLRIESDPRSWEGRRLGFAAEMGSHIIQKSKDAAPFAVAGVALVGAVAFGGKYKEDGKLNEDQGGHPDR